MLPRGGFGFGLPRGGSVIARMVGEHVFGFRRRVSVLIVGALALAHVLPLGAVAFAVLLLVPFLALVAQFPAVLRICGCLAPVVLLGRCIFQRIRIIGIVGVDVPRGRTR